MNGIELQDREFFAAIREGREPNASVAQVLPCYRVLDAAGEAVELKPSGFTRYAYDRTMRRNPGIVERRSISRIASLRSQ